MDKIEEIIEKIRLGDGLTDSELEKGLDFFKDMAMGLRALGPNFYHAWKECNFTFMKLEGYQAARFERKNREKKPDPKVPIAPHRQL